MPTTLALYCLILVAITFLQDGNAVDFSELGKLLLGGFVLAVVVAVAYTFIRLRWRDKNPSSGFVSINPIETEDEPVKAARD
jgi:hypothetical protein